MAASARRWRALVVVALFFVLASLVAPLSPGGQKVQVPPDRELDAVQECLLVADGIDKLLHRPLSYYDTAVLYPDHNQLRTTEPFLGFALLGLPLRAIVHLGDADVFEALRWGLVFASLVYAWLLLEALGVGRLFAAAGAVLCILQPDLVEGVDRLQILAIPLVLAVLYHGLRAWSPGPHRRAHAAALFFFAALYPLCGVINAVACVVATVLVLPLLARLLPALGRDNRLVAIVLPLLFAGILAGLALAPWLIDRSDLGVYATPAFLEVKHWNSAPVPAKAADIGPFVTGHLGAGMAAGVIVLALVGLVSIATGRWRGIRKTGDEVLLVEALLAALVASAVLRLAAGSLAGAPALSWVTWLFQVACYAALAAFWRDQLRVPAAEAGGLRRGATAVSAGLAAFLLLASFGPLFGSNGHPLATHFMRLLLGVLPALKSIREFGRLWSFGGIFLGLYLVMRLSQACRERGRLLRLGAAAVLVVAALSSLWTRRLVASENIEAPRDFIRLAGASRVGGALYVHPYMKWNSMSGVWMIAAARELHRPIVNGYLGISPPWFPYAARVLHRFPDPEALWLLRRWNVRSVVSLQPIQAALPGCAIRAVENELGQSVWELGACREEVPHPSEPGRVPAAAERIEAQWSQLDDRTVRLAVPARFETAALEVRFRASALEAVPGGIDVFEGTDGGQARLNDGASGEWLEALAADALVDRRPPVAFIRLQRPVAGELRLRSRSAGRAPLERIILVGRWR